ncbi:MAG TPA: riboflavin synthase [Solirubrobacterales bacterium]|nr:riboflavin synthase [Solirubrobacterales bacterium]
MFSGLVADLGRVKTIDADDEGARIELETSLAGQIELGDSVAVNGVCLTATAISDSGFSAEAMRQTLGLTSLGELEDGRAVNLELALRADQRLGGHIVQGHVDGVGEIVSLTEDGFSLRVRFSIPAPLANYVVPQGSITLEGVSLTVTECGEDWAEVALIPETRERTTLGDLRAGQRINVECDVIAKYVERMVSPYAARIQATESERQ